MGERRREKTQKQIELADRRRKVTALLRARVDRQEIARQLNISEPTITRDVKVIKEGWRKEYTEDYSHFVSDEISVLADDEHRWRVEMMNMLKPKKVKLIVKRRGKEYVMEEEIASDQMGAMYAYDRIMAIMRQRAKILGIEAPTKIAQTDEKGKFIEVDRMTDEQRFNRLKELLITAGVGASDKETES